VLFCPHHYDGSKSPGKLGCIVFLLCCSVAQVQYWVVGGCGEQCGKEKECHSSGQFPVKYVGQKRIPTKELNREDYGVDK
jgi:hypothetical protein